MTHREDALRIIRFDSPERIAYSLPAHSIFYCGCNHEGYAGGGHHLPVGSTWVRHLGHDVAEIAGGRHGLDTLRRQQ
jgi:hypothetical protein